MKPNALSSFNPTTKRNETKRNHQRHLFSGRPLSVKLQWIKEPPKEIVVSLNQELKVDCLAQGEPKPAMRWEKLDSTQTTFAQGPTSALPSTSISSSPMSSASQTRRLGPPASSLQFPSQSTSAHLDGLMNGAKNQLASSKCRCRMGRIIILALFASAKGNPNHLIDWRPRWLLTRRIGMMHVSRYCPLSELSKGRPTAPKER